MKYVYIAAGSLLLLAGAFAAGRYTVPTKIEHHTEYLTRTRTVRTTVVHRVVDTKWKRIVVTQPDGSSVETETGETHSKEESAESVKTAEVEKAKEASKTTHSDGQNWHVYIHAGVDLPNLRNGAGGIQPVFGASVGYRLLGPIWVNVGGYTNGLVTAGAGLQF